MWILLCIIYILSVLKSEYNAWCFSTASFLIFYDRFFISFNILQNSFWIFTCIFWRWFLLWRVWMCHFLLLLLLCLFDIWIARCLIADIALGSRTYFLLTTLTFLIRLHHLLLLINWLFHIKFLRLIWCWFLAKLLVSRWFKVCIVVCLFCLWCRSFTNAIWLLWLLFFLINSLLNRLIWFKAINVSCWFVLLKLELATEITSLVIRLNLVMNTVKFCNELSVVYFEFNCCFDQTWVIFHHFLIVLVDIVVLDEVAHVMKPWCSDICTSSF